MNIFLKILLFIVTNIIGYFLIIVINILFVKAGIYPNPEDQTAIDLIRTLLFGISVWIWAGCALLSTSYFFLSGNKRFVALFSPVYIPAIYVIGTIVYHL